MRSKIKIFAMLLLLIFVTALAGCSANKETPKEESTKAVSLYAYVGANLKDPVTELAQKFEQKTGVKVEMNFNNSGALLNQLETTKKGDIYLPGNMSFVDKAKQAGHIENTAGPVAYVTPVIITPKDNPAKITKVEDLAKDGVKLVIPDKEATAIGKTAFKIFKNAGIDAKVEKNILASMETPAKVVTAITMGQGNAGIVEISNTVKSKDKIEVVEIDPKINMVEEIPVATLKYSANKDQADAFMKFATEEGPAVFAKYGFRTKQ
ncbi:MAG TPA: molybdate ABC transporter substrate-binding protein [Desulfotomaculum sp.]|nr:MAG: Molybdenum ABC transporter, periplasmic molybdate-binding protein [Desulfotomaculum sp. 46_296]HAG11193.1 molybdate ABC transporter substrate-binding protein [Desulfotomaculum sp.]HBY03155.1 molybdate ABC transporter substrate-binding protein [Desulfotomaculum sp.]